ncbi:MAG: hypothetical protein WBP46_01860 [Thiolinea sp.]
MPASGTKQLASDPSQGGLLATIQALQTGSYEQHLQSKRTELQHWRGEQAKQQTAIARLSEQQARLQQKKIALTKASSSHTLRTQTKQQRIIALQQQHTELRAETQSLQAAIQRLDQSVQNQAQQQGEEQRRVSALLAERERLRQALKLLISSDNSLTKDL